MRETVGILLIALALAPSVRAEEPSDLTENSVDFSWSAVDTQAEQAAYISRQIRGWRKQYNDSGKTLRVVYFHPHDRQPLTNHLDRWDGIMTDIQRFFRDEMTRLGYPNVTLSLERESGKLKIHHVQGALPDNGAYSYRSGARIREEVFSALEKKGIDATKETVLIVCGLSRSEENKVTIYSPFYGMGADHTRGICFAADSDRLAIEGLRPDTEKLILQVKEHRGFEPFTIPRFNTTYIGGVVHELGHGLSLPHCHATQEQKTLGTALMGAGNYTYRQEWRKEGPGTFLTHAHAVRLLVHPVFSGTTQQCAESPRARIRSLDVSLVDDEIQLCGRLEAGIPAIAMIAYNDRENPGQTQYHVNNDYDATTWLSVISPQAEFSIGVGDLKDGDHQLRLVSVHANGAAVVRRLHYTLADGVPDFSRTKEEIAKITTDAVAP